MATKISYEIAIEGLDEYGGIVDIDIAKLERGINLKGWVKNIDYPYQFSIIKRSYDTEWGDSDDDYNPLAKDGTFFKVLPKYIMKIIEPCINESINNKNFKSV